MMKFNPRRFTVPILLLLALLILLLSGCESSAPPPGGQEVSQPGECEQFSCAKIGYLNSVFINVEESVGIGVPRNHQFEHELEVNGTILAEEVIVQANVADYVFDSGYNLIPLEHVEDYITKNHHLPGVPSAFAVQTSGGHLNIGDSYRTLLEKIEELTLYTIKQEKRIAALESLLTADHKARDSSPRTIPK